MHIERRHEGKERKQGRRTKRQVDMGAFLGDAFCGFDNWGTA